jgi:hypothetical protein
MEKTTLLVGISGKARSGKDYVANLIADQVRGARIMPLSLHVKALARVLGMREKDPTALQILGTDVMRRFDPGVWIRCHWEWVVEETPAVAIVPDVRFKNEVTYIRRTGGLIYRLCRSARDGSPFISDDRDSAHLSETELDGIDAPTFTVESGDVTSLVDVARRIVKDIRDRVLS